MLNPDILSHLPTEGEPPEVTTIMNVVKILGFTAVCVGGPAGFIWLCNRFFGKGNPLKLIETIGGDDVDIPVGNVQDHLPDK